MLPNMAKASAKILSRVQDSLTLMWTSVWFSVHIQLTEVNSVLNSDSEILDIKGKRMLQIAHNDLCVMPLRILKSYFKLDLPTCSKVVHSRN